MSRRTIKNLLKKEDGAGLVLALMVLMVFAILGIAVAGVTVGSHKLGNISRDSNSAYYIAEAGANLAYEGIKNGVMPAYASSSNNEAIFFTNIAGLISDFNPKVYAEDIFDTQFGDQPKATITISDPKEEDDGKLYTITSIGEVDGKSRTVEKSFLVKFVPTTTGGGDYVDRYPPMPEGSTLIVKNGVNYAGGSITGDVFVDSKNDAYFNFIGWSTVKGSIYTNYAGDPKDIITKPENQNAKIYESLEHGELEVPWDNAYMSMLNMIKKPSDEEIAQYKNIKTISFGHKDINNKNSVIIEENTYANKIGPGPDQYGHLFIDNRERDINIVVDSFKVLSWRTVEFLGDGQVNIYVTEEFELTGSSAINVAGDASKLRLYYFGKKPLKLEGNVKIVGNLLIGDEDAVLDLTASGNVAGAILSAGKQINLSGGSNNNAIIILPKGHFNATNGSVNGVVVADSVYISNSGASFTFADFDKSILFPHYVGPDEGSGTGGTGSAPTLADLISAGPALEP